LNQSPVADQWKKRDGFFSLAMTSIIDGFTKNHIIKTTLSVMTAKAGIQ
jgi:hypothetical protein